MLLAREGILKSQHFGKNFLLLPPFTLNVRTVVHFYYHTFRFSAINGYL